MQPSQHRTELHLHGMESAIGSLTICCFFRESAAGKLEMHFTHKIANALCGCSAIMSTQSRGRIDLLLKYRSLSQSTKMNDDDDDEKS